MSEEKYMGELEMTKEQIDEKMKNDYIGECPEGYELLKRVLIDRDENYVKDYHEINELYEHRLKRRIEELRIKLMDGTITPEEREELKLLIG